MANKGKKPETEPRKICFDFARRISAVQAISSDLHADQALSNSLTSTEPKHTERLQRNKRWTCGLAHNATLLLWMVPQFMGSIKGIKPALSLNHIMAPTPISFRFSDLPTELALIIFKYAAQPDFTQPNTWLAKNSYSSALALSLVSKIVRRTVLPELLHTVLLPEARHVAAFIQALRMQKTYVDQQQHDLSLDYTSHVHRMWFGYVYRPLSNPQPTFISSSIPSATKPDLESDVSLLAPVILAVPSLAIECASLYILSDCLKYACNSDVDLNVDHKDSPLPWSTKSLTLSGDVTASPWWPFIGTIHGYTFLTSIQHLTLLAPSPYEVPSWMARAPFKQLQTFSMLISHGEPPVAESAPTCSATTTRVELVTFPASLLPDHWTFKEIRAYIENGVGTMPTVPLPVPRSGKLCTLCLDCQSIWANGCEGPGQMVQVPD
ncbi:uncharacterized protein F5891DRAFT_1180834 [Suillus fuscotomentosus]|uniref:Uncharacterized protein n=1 Tax=Suillus fuscotomentosus TaxID=1912939 RepID=A0AAD4EKE3_9AGAM|nr:uncharacterized protein F5891DRAFT_1180834 [Suillus fuscotomentosus]KAG1907807.1 hypothetical protein F5891DRAFT_1180834 [Suillus fuscotomentosus]